MTVVAYVTIKAIPEAANDSSSVNGGESTDSVESHATHMTYA